MKSKKCWFVTALTACLTLSLGICAEALEYNFDGVEDTEYYPSTSYESLYGAKYNYGGSNATDYQWPALPYGVSSNTSVGCMEKVRFPGLVGSIGGSGIESNITNPIQQEPQIPSTSYQPSAYTSVDGTVDLPAEVAEQAERLGIYEFERCVFNPDTCRMTASVTTTFYRKGA